MQYNSPINLSGMSPKERKAYSMWVAAEEQQLRRLRNPSKRDVANKYHNVLNTLVKNLFKQKD